MGAPGQDTSFDVVVVGGGHAGCEAALAAARMGCATLMVTLSLEKIALMPCNPAVGGVGKGQLTREIDALGGEQGRNTDRSCIQMKMLNTGKGPAVQALRAQADKKLYEDNMKRALAREQGLRLLEGRVTRLIVSRETIAGIELADGSRIPAQAVVLACGTFLRGNIVIGDQKFPAGRMGEPPAAELSLSLERQGIALARFQSATPPRVDSRTIDTDRLELQPGDEQPLSFSLDGEIPDRAHVPCYLTYTSSRTHDVVRKYLHLSPIKTGSVSGKGPRYCPSIDRKVINFPDRERHPVFIEPEGFHTTEMYLQGLTTSMPVRVQEEVINATPGLEDARLMRPGYAVEYDFVVPSQLFPTLECKPLPGLYLAGQINGTSGYEEAAAQGLMAGINAAAGITGADPLVLRRDDAYIGVLIDDLVTKGVDEPYRMFTSRAEYRLLLRHDNAHERLSPSGFRYGLVGADILDRVQSETASVSRMLRLLEQTTIHPSSAVNELLAQTGSSALSEPLAALQLLKRPEVSIDAIGSLLPASIRSAAAPVRRKTEVQIKYEGYIARQLDHIEKNRQAEDLLIPPDFSYRDITGVSTEAREKLERIRPLNLGQASRIAGVSPADVAVLSIHLKRL